MGHPLKERVGGLLSETVLWFFIIRAEAVYSLSGEIRNYIFTVLCGRPVVLNSTSIAGKPSCISEQQIVVVVVVVVTDRGAAANNEAGPIMPAPI